MDYNYEPLTIDRFVQQLAVGYVSRGYFFYVTGTIPVTKDPKRIDEKLISKYKVARSKWSRARQKKAGAANIQYLRFERWFVLLATHGHHQFFDEEAASLRDVRKTPIKFAGYSVGYAEGSIRVRIERETYLEIRAWFFENALHRSAQALADQLRALPFKPYGGVKKQLFAIRKEVNLRRHQAGFEPVPLSSLRLKRTQRKPFAAATEVRPET
jgi:hypothetical protein